MHAGAFSNNIYLPFDEAMQVGETLTFYWAMNWDANSGTKGFDIQHSSSTAVVTVSNGGSATITANSNDADTNYGTTPMLVTLERESSSTYQFSMTSRWFICCTISFNKVFLMRFHIMKM